MGILAGRPSQLAIGTGACITWFDPFTCSPFTYSCLFVVFLPIRFHFPSQQITAAMRTAVFVLSAQGNSPRDRVQDLLYPGVILVCCKLNQSFRAPSHFQYCEAPTQPGLFSIFFTLVDSLSYIIGHKKVHVFNEFSQLFCNIERFFLFSCAKFVETCFICIDEINGMSLIKMKYKIHRRYNNRFRKFHIF